MSCLNIVEHAKANACPADFFQSLPLTPETPVPRVTELLAEPLDFPLGPGWQKWPNVQQAYRDALRTAAASVPVYPDRFSGRGIVIVGLGTYFASAYASVRMSRLVGDNYPVELWGLPGETVEPWMQTAVEGLGVTFRFPGDDFRAASRPGWQLKAYALLNSAFEQVRFSDADSYPVEDPAYFWTHRHFERTGAIYFPDRSFQKHDIQPATYGILGMRPLFEPNFESGQFFVDKRRCWGAVWLANWINRHSDYYYNISKDFYGDKDTFRLAHRLLDIDFAILPLLDYRSPAFVHFGWDQKERFVHRVNGKLALEQIYYDTTHQVDDRRNDDLPREAQAWAFLDDLKAFAPPPQPTTAQKLKRGAMGVAKALLGTGGADLATIERRTSVCGGCQHAKLTAGVLQRCELCGCALWAKIRNAAEHCPAGKWPAVSLPILAH